MVLQLLVEVKKWKSVVQWLDNY